MLSLAQILIVIPHNYGLRAGNRRLHKQSKGLSRARPREHNINTFTSKVKDFASMSSQMQRQSYANKTRKLLRTPPRHKTSYTREHLLACNGDHDEHLFDTRTKPKVITHMPRSNDLGGSCS
ncbi:hypothetical protein A2U01_0026488, partial [Trifolium medium]|nr:hypothetical protein [Trifolium medium]